MNLPFRGRLKPLCSFVLIALLVAGGLGWATREALRLEEAQRLTTANAQFLEKWHYARKDFDDQLRLALWRLDARLLPALAREDSRPYAHYLAIYNPFPALTQSGAAWEPGKVYLPSPLLTADLPEWMSLHFQLDASAWFSPQVVPEGIVQTLRKQPLELALQNVTPQRAELLQKLRTKYSPKQALSCFQASGIPMDEVINQTINDLNRNTRDNPTPMQQNSLYSNLNTQAPSQQGLNTSIMERYGTTSRAMQEGKLAYWYDGRNFSEWMQSFQDKKSPIPEQPVEVTLGSMKPIWLPSPKEPEFLLMLREAKVGSRPVYQGFVLDWIKLQDVLKAEIIDLFPNARLLPLVEIESAQANLVMTALPLQLDPGVEPLPPQPDILAEDQMPSAGWTPLRFGLLLAWIATVVALLAVGLGGWSLLNLSERRIRFVSAVTHELRTPLTTLRLYLDLLTSGMIHDPQQRDEYLKTMHGETDRLNRLIGNVLDFARLEKSHPNVEMKTIYLQDLLQQVMDMWQERCSASNKDLVLENTLPEAWQIKTDPKLVEQILGNLIDNARKYSQDATDRRIWIRALKEKNQLILEIEDRGPGVTKQERASIFQAFRRGHDADVKAGGVGLGLALATRWARFIGGRLTVCAGQQHTGACFRLFLPLE